MDLGTIKYEVKDKIAILSFNRPEKRNAFNRQMIEDLEVATQRIRQDESIRCLILTGLGLGFCAGADLS